MTTTGIAPLVKEVSVSAPPARAFEVFTAEIGAWWPAQTHSVEPDRVRDVVLEGRAGGRILEVWEDGTELSWGEVELWDPPRRVRFSWHPGTDPATAGEIEVSFDATGDGTRVTLEHRGWERLGARAAELRANYDEGWDFVLGRYTAAPA